MEKSTVRENPTGRASVTTAPAPSQWQEVTTDDLRAATEKQLFAWMAERGKRGYDAWAEFHWRYASTFHHLVSRLPSMDASEVENLVQDTMVQAWHSAHTYQASAEARDSFDHTLAWLGTIARNLYRAMRRRQKLRLESHDQAGQSADEAASPPDRKRQLSQMHHAIRAAESNMLNFLESPVETMSERRARFQEALVALSERERDVLLTYYEYYDRENPNQHLPENVIAELCTRYQVTPDYLRQIKRRAYEQLKRSLVPPDTGETKGTQL